MTLSVFKTSRTVRLIAAYLFLMMSAQACATAAARPAAAPVAVDVANVPCETPEYQDLLAKRGEQPLSDAEEARIAELYAECVRAAQAAAARAAGVPQSSGGSSIGSTLGTLLGIALLGVATYYLLQVAEEEGYIGGMVPLVE